MQRLAQRIAVITGAAQGMGASHARELAKHGAKVVLTDLNEAAGQALADEIGDSAIFVKQNVALAEDWAKVIRQAESTFGAVNVLVNNAGVLGQISDTVNLSEAEFQKVCDINQLGVFLGMQAVLPGMIEHKLGSIVNISSIAGMVAIYGAPNLAYVASKFAVRGMTKQVAVEYGKYNIRVNSVHPGYIRTPMMAAATDEEGGKALEQIPLQRLADPREVSDLVVFLASNESSFITGMEHVIDGGMTAL